MIYLTFITVGDLPKGPFFELRNEFVKRLSGFVRLTHIAVKNADRAFTSIPAGDTVLLLDADGDSMHSERFAEMLRGYENDGVHLSVLLGGPKGFTKQQKARAGRRISLSPMTTTHDMAHLFFLEQLYRAGTINRGKEYHY
ncbi:MAG: 23S rRNA (pseudouridine(1915)-N(3))-methyltransferase RlmH [bacterium]|nr:23S rRNA (pseudouridine(1915)-N(3))-methyltransferase RlmH [bacterium]MDA1024593.1 23S rRNA (pseudouridine(1915)-N(3))-methyltransferase RlmH [bacterium]